MRTGIADFTLDYGKCPPWLFAKMKSLARAIGIAVISEFGPEEFLKRLSDPVWFQSFGCVLAFDWNASGLTTTTLGALKVAFKDIGESFNFFVCGGKGGTSRKTPDEIQSIGQRLGFSAQITNHLEYASRASAKVDSALIQDGFTLYHHSFLLTKKGQWAVIQQGMNPAFGRARRYHWLGDAKKKFIEEPHQGIASQIFLPRVVNLTDKKSRKNRDLSVELIHSPFSLIKDIKLLTTHSKKTHFRVLWLPDQEFNHHPIEKEKINFENPRISKNINRLIIKQPSNFEQLLMTKNIGGKTIRAISLVAELVYGAPPSYQDPARYTFTHGGKDGTPYPVDRLTYKKTIDVMEKAIKKAFGVSLSEKDRALHRLENHFLPQSAKPATRSTQALPFVQ